MSFNKLLSTNASNTGVIILAAGASKRLGHPKQLVNFLGKPLLQHAIDLCELFGFGSKVLVLGANVGQIKKNISLKGFMLSTNPKWEIGMGESIRVGVNQSLSVQPGLEAILLMVSDQPFQNKLLINEITSRGSRDSIVAAHYQNSIGVPALFGADFFTDLKTLTGDQGAKKVIAANRSV